MKIPESVRIAGMVYSTVEDSTLQRYRGKWGECGPDDLIITIDSGLGMVPERTFQTYIHELFEAINIEYSVELEHQQIKLLTTALYQIIQDNPNIFNEGDVDAN